MENPRREIIQGVRSCRRGGADGNSHRERDERPTRDDVAFGDDADPGKRFRTRGWLPLHRRDRGAQEGYGPDRVLHGPRCAAGIFTADGDLQSIREDVGRHNAVDKVVGEAFLADRVPLSDRVLAVSGRAGFEIMQKAAVAGIPFVVAVGAPSNLSVTLADEFGMTLVGFARGDRFNVYAGRDRVSTGNG